MEQEESLPPSPQPRRAGYHPRQRVAIISSMAILSLIMTGVVFASGVYIGNNREIAPSAFPRNPGAPGPQQPQQGPGQQGAQVQRPGAQQQFGPGNPGGQNPAAPPGGGQTGPQAGGTINGNVITAAANAVTMATPGGPTTVTLDAQTTLVRADGTTFIATDLVRGMNLTVRLRPATNPLTADRVTLTAAPGQ